MTSKIGHQTDTAKLAIEAPASLAVSLEGSATSKDASACLAEFLAGLSFEALPSAVVVRVEEAFVDWFACALAGRGAQPVQILEKFAAAMGPTSGRSQILVSRRKTSAFFAALVNGAASHIVELDDVHHTALLHPGTVVIPAVFAAAQDIGASGRELITAAVAGIETTIRVGEFLGPVHYKTFHSTGTAGTVGAAAGVARLLRCEASTLLHAIGSAGTQAAGLWEFLRDAADSKPLHTGKAAADGLLSAYIARDGFRGATHILEGPQGMGAGMCGTDDPSKLTDCLGTRWGTLEMSFKVHSCCGHTHPSVDAFLSLLRKEHLTADEIAHVTAYVHPGAIDVLGNVAANPQTVHQAKFSMGVTLALIALYGRAGLEEFSEAILTDPRVLAFQQRVEMVLNTNPEATGGNGWVGRVEIVTRDGRRLQGCTAVPKGHPQDSLSRDEIEDKVLRLARYAGGASPEEIRRILRHAWELPEEPDLNSFLLT